MWERHPVDLGLATSLPRRIPILGRLSPADDDTSKIIDAFSNDNYVFLDVSVKFSIWSPANFEGSISEISP